MRYLNQIHIFLCGFLLLASVAPVYAAVVLQYHHVSDATPPSTSISPALFKQHMDYLAANDFKVVPLPSLVKQLKNGEPLPDRTVAITFDDAYISVYQTAFPLLKKRAWPFTVFVNTDPLDQNKKLFSSWSQLKEMAKNGATIANHTRAHDHIVRLRDNESRTDWRQRIIADVNWAEERIQKQTGQTHQILAYPYGEYDQQVKALLKDLGFIAFGQQSGPLSLAHDLQSLPRFPFGGSFGELSDFITKVNTRPFPLKSIHLYSNMDAKKKLQDIVLSFGQRPVLALEMENAAMLTGINCFASGQGAIETQVRDGKLSVQANKPLTAGRARYNCTKASGEAGRFFWYSQQWLTKGENGDWAHND